MTLIGVTNFFDPTKWKLTPYQILVVGFATVIWVGALILMLPICSANGEWTNFLDALFTSTSAVCVTGLVVLDTGTHWSTWGQIVIISLIQIGGLGIMAMTTLIALLIGKKINLRERLIMQEALNQLTFSGIVRLMQYIIKATLLLEFIGGTILAIRWYLDFGAIGIYYGYWHAISAFCNAGFDLFGNFRSVTMYVEDYIVNFVIAGLIIFGGLGFTVISDAFITKKFSKLSLHSKIVLTTTLFLIIFGSIVIYFLEYNNYKTLGSLTFEGKLLASFFQSVSSRTAGYNTIDLGQLEHATIFFIIILMFIGASPTSTGGGIKTSTFALLMSAVWALIRGRDEVELFERRIAPALIYKAFSIFFLSGLLVVVITMMISLVEPTSVPFLNILFEVVSAFGTVGLSTGITPALSASSKFLLIVTMFAGRVGPVTLALALALRKDTKAYSYPEGKITIG